MVTSGGRAGPATNPASGDKRRIGGLGARRPAHPGTVTAGPVNPGASGRAGSPQASNGNSHNGTEGPGQGGDEQFFDQDLMG